MYNSKIFGQLNAVIKQEETQRIKDKISLAEITLLKCMNFDININLPNDFIYVYSSILYPDNEEDIIQYSIRIANDSFYTYVNLIYKNYVVAIACIIVAAKFLSLPTLLDSNFRHLENMKKFSDPIPNSEDEFNKRLLEYENRSFHISLINQKENSSTYFDVLEWNKKIHPYLEQTELMECVKMIVEYYQDCKNYHN